MLSKYTVVFNLYNIVRVVWVLVFEMLQNFELDSSLVPELLLVPDYLNTHNLFVLVVVAPQSLAETTLAKEANDFISESNMVSEYYFVVTILIIIP